MIHVAQCEHVCSYAQTWVQVHGEYLIIIIGVSSNWSWYRITKASNQAPLPTCSKQSSTPSNNKQTTIIYHLWTLMWIKLNNICVHQRKWKQHSRRIEKTNIKLPVFSLLWMLRHYLSNVGKGIDPIVIYHRKCSSPVCVVIATVHYFCSAHRHSNIVYFAAYLRMHFIGMNEAYRCVCSTQWRNE